MAEIDPAEIPAIVCKGLSKDFGDVKALRDLTLLIPRGVTFGLLGPNGAGKTTSIRLWLGLTAPTAGVAYVLGKRIPPREVLPRIG
jgi:ABC-2 type transport system ATP-binding protein